MTNIERERVAATGTATQSFIYGSEVKLYVDEYNNAVWELNKTLYESELDVVLESKRLLKEKLGNLDTIVVLKNSEGSYYGYNKELTKDVAKARIFINLKEAEDFANGLEDILITMIRRF